MTSPTSLSTPWRPHSSDSELELPLAENIIAPSVASSSSLSPVAPLTPQQTYILGSPSPSHNVGQTTSISADNNTPSVVLPPPQSFVNTVPSTPSLLRPRRAFTPSFESRPPLRVKIPPHRTSSVPLIDSRQGAVSPSMGFHHDVVPVAPHQAVLPKTLGRTKVVINDVSSFDVDFKPVVPKYISRYYRNSLQIANGTQEYSKIPPLMRGFPNKSLPWLNDLDVSGWQSYIHPDGVLYLHNEIRRTYTQAKGITSPRKFRLVEGCMNALRTSPLCTTSVNLNDSGIELVLQLPIELADHDRHVVCKYYFVDHANRTLFWLHEYDNATKHVFGGMHGVHDPSHIAHALEYQYWLHCDSYPNYKHVRVKLLEELRNIVIFARADMIMREDSLSPYSADDLTNILKLINHLKVDTENNNSPHCICVIARFMRSFSHSKFFNFHGQPYARPNADTSVFKENTNPSYPLAGLSLILNAMLFGAQQAHYDQLQSVWVDKTVIQRRWHFFSSNLVAEWTGITIYSTVMLVVDVTFLAVPNMNIQQSHSVGVIAVYVSITFIIGSLIISLLLSRHIQSYGPNSFRAVANFLTKMTRTRFGMRVLATIYSLPYAMLLWGMISFSIAFLYNVFKSTTIAMLVSVIGGCTVVAIFILSFLWMASEVQLGRLVKCCRRPVKLVNDGVGIADDKRDLEMLADSADKSHPHPNPGNMHQRSHSSGQSVRSQIQSSRTSPV